MKKTTKILIAFLIIMNIVFAAIALNDNNTDATDNPSETQLTDKEIELAEKEAALLEKEKYQALKEAYYGYYGTERQILQIVEPVEGGNIFLFISSGKALASQDSEEKVDVTIESLYIGGLFYDLRALQTESDEVEVETTE